MDFFNLPLSWDLIISPIKYFLSTFHVESPLLHCQGTGFNSWSGNQDPVSHVVMPKIHKMFLVCASTVLGIICRLYYSSDLIYTESPFFG